MPELAFVLSWYVTERIRHHSKRATIERHATIQAFPTNRTHGQLFDRKNKLDAKTLQPSSKPTIKFEIAKNELKIKTIVVELILY